MAKNSNVRELSLEQAERAIRLCFQANIPVALWGKPGIGKSSLIKQVSDNLDWKLFDFRLSDKEPSDLGGIPFPVDGNRVKFLVIKPDEEHPENGLPFDSNEKAVVLLDEFDRADLSVQNVALQIILDRRVNGHKLSPHARIVIAGNGTTDVGTSPLSKAAANRICHLYITTEGQLAVESWMTWADRERVDMVDGVKRTTPNASHILRGFVQLKPLTWNGETFADTKNKAVVEEMAYPTPRSFEYADRICIASERCGFKTADILPAVIAGCVGVGAGKEFLDYRDTFSKAPNIFDILADPKKIKIPENDDVLYSLALALTEYVAENSKMSETEKTKKAKEAEAVAVYGLRWKHQERAAHLFNRLAEKNPTVKETDSYKEWAKRDRVVAPAKDEETTMDGYCMNCKKHSKMKNPVRRELPNGRVVTEATCTVCGQKTNRLGEPKK